MPLQSSFPLTGGLTSVASAFIRAVMNFATAEGRPMIQSPVGERVPVTVTFSVGAQDQIREDQTHRIYFFPFPVAIWRQLVGLTFTNCPHSGLADGACGGL